MEIVHDLLMNISEIYMGDKAKDNRSIIDLKQLIGEILADGELKCAVDSLSKKALVFDKLREALRIAMPEGTSGLNDDGDESDIKSIEKEVAGFKEWLVSDESQRTTYLKMIEQIDKYWEKLFADPLIINTQEGLVTIAPQRTNNILERFFRGEKRRSRKKSGTASLSKTLKTILADTPLVRNLENEEYQKIILNGCSSLAERFSQIDDKIVRDQLKRSNKDCDKIPSEVKKVISEPNFPDKISALFFKISNINANCHLRS